MSDRDLPAADYAERKHRRTSAVERLLIRLAFLPQLLLPRYDARKLAAPIRLEIDRTQPPTEREVQSLRYELRRAGLQPDLVLRALAFVVTRAGNRMPLPPTNGALAGSALLLQGRAVELQADGERALACALAAAVAALAGKPVHVIVPTGHFARRRLRDVGALFEALDLSVAHVDEAMPAEQRRDAYRCDVVYCAQRTVALDCLADRMALKGRAGSVRLRASAIGAHSTVVQELMLGGLHFTIVDEADVVLADAAQTALTLDGNANMSQEVRWLQDALVLAARLQCDVDYTLPASVESLVVPLSAAGRAKLGQFTREMSGIWQGVRRREEIVELALATMWLLQKDHDYAVATEGLNESRLRLDPQAAALAGGQTQARMVRLLLEIREGCAITATRQTLARITYQRFVRSYVGCAAIASDMQGLAGELWRVCRLRRVRLGPHSGSSSVSVMSVPLQPDATAHVQEIAQTVTRLREHGQPLLLVTRDHVAAKALSVSLIAAGLQNFCLAGLQNEEEAAAFSGARAAGRITVMPHTAACGVMLHRPEPETAVASLSIVITQLLPSQRHIQGLLRRCRRDGVPGVATELLAADDELLAAYVPAWLRKRAAALPGRTLQKYCQWRYASETAMLRDELLRADDYLGELFAFAGHTG
jgi:preprotein translocase subunit SecA